VKKIIITGVNGIIGSKLNKRFIDKGYYVIGVGRIDPKAIEQKSEQFEYKKLDITDRAEVIEFFNKKHFNYLIHCAALVHKNSPDLSFENFMKINYEGTKNIFDAMFDNKNKNDFEGAIFLSTIEVYGGECEQRIFSEEDKCKPITYYAKSKLAAEEYLLKIKKQLDFPITILRLAPAYSDTFLRNIKVRVMAPGKFLYYKVGEGKLQLSLCSINNVIDVIEKIIVDNFSIPGTFNITDDVVYSTNELLGYFQETRGKKPIIRIPEKLILFAIKILGVLFKNKRERLKSVYCKLTKNNIYDIEKIKKVMHYKPKWNFKNTVLDNNKND